jgi:mRNA (guanine-N7-)-methyltransferase
MDQNQIVREHYNARPEVDPRERKNSPIFFLKSVNNFVKSCLINEMVPPRSKVLDVCCGKGGG